jgi:hypothetical protein
MPVSLIKHLGGATSIGANWQGGVIPGATDIAVFDSLSSGGSIDLLNCLGVDVRADFAGTLTQDADIILGAGGFVWRAGTFVEGSYDFITEGAILILGGVCPLSKNKVQARSTTNNLFTIDGLNVYTLSGLNAFAILSGVEFYVENAICYRSTGDYMLIDSRNVASTSDWGNFTWGEILFKIRSKINEPNPAFFTDEELMVFFNESQLYFARETKFIKREQAFTVKQRPSSPPYQYVMMPSGFLGVISVGLQSKTQADDLQWIPNVGLAGRSKQSYQEQAFYLVDRGEIRITHDVDVLATNLLVRYYQAPNVLTDPEDLDVLTQVYDEYLDDVILGVLMACHLKRKEYEEYNYTEVKFVQRIKEAIWAEGRRTGNKQIQVIK